MTPVKSDPVTRGRARLDLGLAFTRRPTYRTVGHSTVFRLTIPESAHTATYYSCTHDSTRVRDAELDLVRQRLGRGNGASSRAGRRVHSQVYCIPTIKSTPHVLTKYARDAVSRLAVRRGLDRRAQKPQRDEPTRADVGTPCADSPTRRRAKQRPLWRRIF